MANPLYAHNPSYGTGVSRSLADPYLPESPWTSSRVRATSERHPTFESSAPFYSITDRTTSLYADSDVSRGLSLGNGGGTGSAARISGGIATSVAPRSVSWPGISYVGSKRSSEVIYNQSVLDAHNSAGQSEAWFSTNSIAKRLRFDTTSSFSNYPQRPGEKECAHYILTGICKFGEGCKFDHPSWVGGIPDLKEVQQVPQVQPVLQVPGESFPQRPGEPDCPFFLKTQQCKFGLKCKFNHPTNKQVPAVTSAGFDASALPERPSAPQCSFYMKTGRCKYGANCKFHHPKDVQISPVGQETAKQDQTDSYGSYAATGNVMAAVSAPRMYNNQGLPIRAGEVDCPFYMKNGSCKYGVSCRYSHPERNGYSFSASPAFNLNAGAVNPAASILQALGATLAQSTIGLGSANYPQRPGQIECDYYMKTGICRFGERCKFHHPIDRSAPSENGVQQHGVKLTLAGLPRREGAMHCPFYMKTGTCKFGANCKFDHPPPGEVMAAAAAAGQGKSASFGGATGDEDQTEEATQYNVQ